MVLPGAPDVYVAPEVRADVDLFFYNGWWWRPVGRPLVPFPLL